MIVHALLLVVVYAYESDDLTFNRSTESTGPNGHVYFIWYSDSDSIAEKSWLSEGGRAGVNSVK